MNDVVKNGYVRWSVFVLFVTAFAAITVWHLNLTLGSRDILIEVKTSVEWIQGELKNNRQHDLGSSKVETLNPDLYK